jgi:hypothetical protein
MCHECLSQGKVSNKGKIAATAREMTFANCGGVAQNQTEQLLSSKKIGRSM